MTIKSSEPESTREYDVLDLLNRTLTGACRAPYYRQLGLPPEVSGFKELHALPLTTKQDLRDQSPFGLLAVAREEVARYHESFGTTGEPVSVWLTEDDWDSIAQLINRIGPNFTPADQVLIRFPYAISAPAHMVERAALLRGASVISAGSRTPISPYSRIVKMLRRLEVSVLCALPLEAMLLLETARLMGLACGADFPSLRTVCVAGEYVSLFRLRMLKKLWQVPVIIFYGTTELGHLASSCPFGHLHIFPDQFIYEVIDPITGAPVASGDRGVLVVTTLQRRAMPLIRFVTGDVVRIFDPGRCPCGCANPTLVHYGRETAYVLSGREQIYHAEIETDIFSLLEGQPVRMWFVVVEDNNFRVRLDLPEGTEIPSVAALEYELAERWRLPVTVEMVEPGKLFPSEILMAVEPVRKPQYVADWRGTGLKPASLIEYLRGPAAKQANRYVGG